MRPACVQKYDFAISPSAFAVSTPWQVRWAGRQLTCFSDICWCDVVCTTDDRSAVNRIFKDHIVRGVSCLSIVVHLSALHAMLYVVQVCTYKFREGYIGHKLPLLALS